MKVIIIHIIYIYVFQSMFVYFISIVVFFVMIFYNDFFDEEQIQYTLKKGEENNMFLRSEKATTPKMLYCT